MSRSCRSCRCSCCASRTSVNVATFHAYAGFSPSYEFGSRALRGYAARLHGRIAVSAAARHFIDRYFPGDYKVIPNGVDVGRFANAVPLARWQDGTPNVLFVGRHESRKGLLDLLKAHRVLRKSGETSRLLIVGSGPQEREARRYVATRGLQGVEFLGRVSDDEKAQLYKTADVYVSPATGGESFGIVLLEAMAAGTADRVLGHPRLQGRRPARSRGPARPAPRAARARRRAWGPAPAARATSPAPIIPWSSSSASSPTCTARKRRSFSPRATSRTRPASRPSPSFCRTA